MRRQDKYKNIEQANLMLENSYLKRKSLLKEEPIEYPDSITVKLTDEWEKVRDLFRVPYEVTLPNNPKVYVYIGNTKIDGFSGIIYFASRKGNLVFITGLDVKGADKNWDINSLTNQYPKSKTEIDNSGLRKFPTGTTTLGPNPDYQGPLEIGMTDHRGYFKIVSLD